MVRPVPHCFVHGDHGVKSPSTANTETRVSTSSRLSRCKQSHAYWGRSACCRPLWRDPCSSGHRTRAPGLCTCGSEQGKRALSGHPAEPTWPLDGERTLKPPPQPVLQGPNGVQSPLTGAAQRSARHANTAQLSSKWRGATRTTVMRTVQHNDADRVDRDRVEHNVRTARHNSTCSGKTKQAARHALEQEKRNSDHKRLT